MTPTYDPDDRSSSEAWPAAADLVYRQRHAPEADRLLLADLQKAGASKAWSAATDLVYWLRHAPEKDRLLLADLRKGLTFADLYGRRQGPATAFSIRRAQQKGNEEILLGVARLFAHYNRAPRHQLQLDVPAVGFGRGSMGAALGRLSQATENDSGQGRSRLLLDTLLRRRARTPWRELTMACSILRERRVEPPDWRELVVDLTDWHRRMAWPDRSVRERWADDFYVASNKRTDP